MLLMKKAVYKIWNLWSFKQIDKHDFIYYMLIDKHVIAWKRIHQIVNNNGYILMVGKVVNDQVFKVFSIL